VNIVARPREFDADAALDAAVDQFWEHGYAATSIEDLSERLGISRPAIYRTWGSKELLYRAALERYTAGSSASSFVRRLAEEPERARQLVRERLHEIVQAALDDPHQRGCFVVNAITERAHDDEATLERTAASLKLLEDRLADALRAGVRAGRLSQVDDPRALARLLVTVIQGLRVVGKARPERAVLVDAVDQVMRLVR